MFLRFKVMGLTNPLRLDDNFEQISVSLEPFEMQYLSSPVVDDFREALTCYANSCWNAFGAMWRRCIQSVSTALGADGTSKVQAQLTELKDMGVADEETFQQLHQIMLAGHDGAHPHLPALSPARAAILLQLMKDVFISFSSGPRRFVRRGNCAVKQVNASDTLALVGVAD